MKKVLIIANQFPPMGGSGVQRTTKFTKYLHEFGWEPVVLTREIRNMQLTDNTLLNDIPSHTKIYRTYPWDFRELPSYFGLMGKIIGQKALIPDAERIWAIASQQRAIDIVRSEKIDLIYTTSYPYSDHLLGLYLKKTFPSIPWVVDFRDEWMNNPYLLDNPHNRIRMKIEKRMEKEVIHCADRIIANTPVMYNNFVRDYEVAKEKFSVIPNGYDQDDFEKINRSMPRNERFTITYTGLLYGRRKPDTFFIALSELIQTGAIAKDKISVRFIGNYKIEKMLKAIEDYNLSEVIRIMNYLPHRECIQQLLQSNAVLLIEGKGPGAEAFYTGKLFEYMNTGRPIIALIPQNGVAAKAILETETGLVADYDDIEKIKCMILDLYNKWSKGIEDLTPRWEKISRFERKALTEDLAEVFMSAY